MNVKSGLILYLLVPLFECELIFFKFPKSSQEIFINFPPQKIVTHFSLPFRFVKASREVWHFIYLF